MFREIIRDKCQFISQLHPGWTRQPDFQQWLS